MEAVPLPLLVTLAGLCGGLVSLLALPLKGRAWVRDTALEAIESQAGRTTILAIAAERHLRIEDKLDSLAASVGALGARIDTHQTSLQQQIAKLDAETRQLEVRLVRIEQQGRH